MNTISVCGSIEVLFFFANPCSFGVFLLNILGISALYHDSAACLVQDGTVISAAQEERFTRKKNDATFPHHAIPHHAIQFCLKQSNLSVQDLDYVAFYDKPFLTFDRLLHSYLHYAPKGFSSFLKSIPQWMKQKLWMRDLISDELGYEGKIIFPEHHMSHAASTFYPSPFQEAAFLTMDGVMWKSCIIFFAGKTFFLSS